MKMLVTGANGFIGSNLSLELERQGHEVIATDKTSRNKNLNGFEGEYLQQDICEINFEKFKDVEAIFHQAAITDTVVYDERLMMKVNYEAFERLLKFSTDNEIPLVYASSAATYGAAKSPQKEEDAGKPLNVYGISKWKMDCLAKSFIEKGCSRVIGLRYFNVFGPREAHKGKMASMIWQLYLQMKENKKPKVFKFGEQTRDHIYVKDIVRANILALESGKSDVVNVGSGKETSFNKIIEVLNKEMGMKLEPEYVDNPYTKYYQVSTKADLSLADKLINYKPIWTFESGVKDYIKEIEKI